MNKHIQEKYPPAILLMGPTASGKSNIAIEIARHFPVEIISVDSAQVYREMNIGSAKPDKETQAAIPHHLIDLIDPKSGEPTRIGRKIVDGKSVRYSKKSGEIIK